MNEKRKRAWFQYHLSTAMILMFVAAILLWANIRPYPARDYIYRNELTGSKGWGIRADPYGPFLARGWPTAFMIVAAVEPRPLFGGEYQEVFDVHGMIGDFVFAFTILPIVGVLCEWSIRRKARKNQ